jgi:hypothetical protein
MGTKRHDSFGLEVMRERAARLGGALTIGEREPHGTFVDVQVGERPTRKSRNTEDMTDTDDTDHEIGSDDTAPIQPDSRAAR